METSSTMVPSEVVVLVEEVTVEAESEVTVLVTTVLELDIVVWSVVVLVAPTIVLVNVEDTVTVDDSVVQL
jgi:hypothetical protein